jgi:hypothetical protein
VANNILEGVSARKGAVCASSHSKHNKICIFREGREQRTDLRECQAGPVEGPGADLLAKQVADDRAVGHTAEAAQITDSSNLVCPYSMLHQNDRWAWISAPNMSNAWSPTLVVARTDDAGQIIIFHALKAVPMGSLPGVPIQIPAEDHRHILRQAPLSDDALERSQRQHRLHQSVGGDVVSI